LEKAILITRISELDRIESDVDRIYFGHEFCERRLPNSEELLNVINWCKKNEKPMTLLTPPIKETGLGYLESLFPIAAQSGICEEVCINDWGALRLMAQMKLRLKPILGRLLVKLKRDPRILLMKKKLPSPALDHFSRANVDTPEMAGFLRDLGIHRVEMDNVLQGINREGDVLQASIYFPWAYVSTTFLCLTAGSARNSRPHSRSIFPCEKECLHSSFSLQHQHMPETLIMKGNTYFFETKKLPFDLESNMIDRIVYEPEIPF